MSARSQTLHLRSALLPQGWADDVRVHMQDGVFVQIECGVSSKPGDECAPLGLPGLPNLHSHAFQRGMAGLTEYRTQQIDSFWTWRELMYRFLAQLTPDDVEAITAQAFMEMLEAGFTRVAEFHYLHHAPDGAAYDDVAEMSSRVVAASLQTGIGLSLLPVFYAHGGFGGAPSTDAQRRFLFDLDGYARLLERCRELARAAPQLVVGVAPHSLRAVTESELTVLTQLSGPAPIHIHIAEQLREVQECEAWSGQRPIAWLLDKQAVDRRFCLVHATHATGDELLRLSATGATIGLCPITEADLGDGIFPALEWLEAGGAYGIGSDSNVAISLCDELRLLEYGQRLQRRGRNVLASSERHTGRALFERSLRGGAQASGVPAGIEVGAPADVVTLAVDQPAFVGRTRDQLLDTWIFSVGTRGIDRVWSRGVPTVVQGQHRDRAAISARYKQTLERLLQV